MISSVYKKIKPVKTQKRIADYKLEGKQLFFPNAGK